MERGTFDFRNLRPCSIIQRETTPEQGKFVYSVLIKNRSSLDEDARVPKNKIPLVVSHVPRQAIRFWDKMYTTDVHLPNTFRHEIGFSDYHVANVRIGEL